MTPSKQLRRISVRSAIPILPCASANWRPASCLCLLCLECPAKSLPLPTILRRVPPRILRTDKVAMCAGCDSPVVALCTSNCHAHWRSGTHGIMSHNCLSVSILLVIFSPTYSTQPIGVPNTVMPRGCHTSGPKSLMLRATECQRLVPMHRRGCCT